MSSPDVWAGAQEAERNYSRDTVVGERAFNQLRPEPFAQLIAGFELPLTLSIHRQGRKRRIDRARSLSAVDRKRRAQSCRVERLRCRSDPLGDSEFSPCNG